MILFSLSGPGLLWRVFILVAFWSVRVRLNSRKAIRVSSRLDVGNRRSAAIVSLFCGYVCY